MLKFSPIDDERHALVEVDRDSNLVMLYLLSAPTAGPAGSSGPIGDLVICDLLPDGRLRSLEILLPKELQRATLDRREAEHQFDLQFDDTPDEPDTDGHYAFDPSNGQLQVTFVTRADSSTPQSETVYWLADNLYVATDGKAITRLTVLGVDL